MISNMGYKLLCTSQTLQHGIRKGGTLAKAVCNRQSRAHALGVVYNAVAAAVEAVRAMHRDALGLLEHQLPLLEHLRLRS